MSDIRNLYIELIKDYAPSENIAEHKQLTNSQMLFNLIQIKKNNFNCIDNMYNRFTTLIEVFQILGVK